MSDSPLIQFPTPQSQERFGVEEALLREPNLWIPGKKPIGPVKIDQSIGIQKEVCVVFNDKLTGGLHDLCGRTSVVVSSNYSSPPYQHWFQHPLGIYNHYISDYVNADCLRFPEALNIVGNGSGGGGSKSVTTDVSPIYFGAVFTLIGSEAAYSEYCFIADDNYTTAGHIGSFSSLKYDGDTSININSGDATGHIYTVPNMRDGKPHCAIGKIWFDGTADLRWSQLILDGVAYTPQSTSDSLFYYCGGMSAFSSPIVHHNRSLEGIIHMLWISRNATVEQCIAESLDPYQFLIPA